MDKMFPNRAGDKPDNDSLLRAELRAAGIPTIQDVLGKGDDYLLEMFREQSGEVVTGVFGELHGWSFKRAWYYWVAQGPGIDVETAEKLHAEFGKVVRVDGDCSSPSPRERFKGFGCGSYHVDTPEGLKALADVIKSVVERSQAKQALVAQG